MTEKTQANVAAALLGICALALCFYVPGCIDRQNAKRLCDEMCGKILIQAKIDPPEYGDYEAILEEHDPWHHPLVSMLRVSELSNSVLVKSYGEDGLVGTNDDIYAAKHDVHVRKTIAKGIEGGAHSFGKGLTTGVMEGLGEASDAVVDKAKQGLSTTKNKIMSRFKKQENSS